jgi:hypothetical protein
MRRGISLAAALISCLPIAALAGTLASAALLAPLAPEQESRLMITLPSGFNPAEPVWLVYELVALAPDEDADGSVDLEQSFEGVKTPLQAFYATFKSSDMESRESGGTVAQRLEAISGHREPAELRQLMGNELYSAYAALDSGKGRVLAGRRVQRLPAPEKSDTPLLVSVERAAGMQPLALKVTVGQGALPAQFQEKTEDSAFYKAGYAGGLALFGWLVMRFFRRRRD